MCGFIVLAAGSRVDESLVQRRGPDATNSVTRGGLDFYHYLLHVTGERTPQPFEADGIVCVYNGEIYNHAFARSDGENLIPLYQQFGPTFAQHLDGEFAIALYDFRRRRAVFATDPFGTKPLFVRGTECASYRSAVGGQAVPPNTTLIHHFDGTVEGPFINFPFDFGAQQKRSYDDWIAAFAAAVAKRARADCFIGLSSGYDSGAIACELLRQGVPFHAYSIRGAEHPDVLSERLRRTDSTLFDLSVDDYESQQLFLRKHCEPASLRAEAEMDMHCDELFDDPGAIGSSFIFSRARASGRKVYLSGQGADEILSDYALTRPYSSFHGVFPKDLKIWKNFYGGCQRAYLRKEEYVGGSHGIETRYPFLDTRVVQEFLWLAPELKNLCYKAPLHEYLTRNAFPFWEGSKMGFAADMNLDPPNDARLSRLLAWKETYASMWE